MDWKKYIWTEKVTFYDLKKYDLGLDGNSKRFN